jgi:hypothetical protein
MVRNGSFFAAMAHLHELAHIAVILPLLATIGTTAQAQIRPRRDLDVHQRPGIEARSDIEVMVPEERRPGTHTVVLDLSRSLRRSKAKYFPDRIYGCRPSSGATQEGVFAGWSQLEIDGTPCTAGVTETAVAFDDGVLDQIPVKTVTRAVLAYDEAPTPDACVGWIDGFETLVSPTCWRSGGGAPEPKPDGCVVVRIPTWDWLNVPPPPGLIPYSANPRPAVQRLGPREWDVTEPYNWQNTPGAVPLGAASWTAGYGFLLGAGPSIEQLEAEDNTSCASVITNLRLSVTYTVPENRPYRSPK